MKTYRLSDLENFDQRYRANFVNSLSGFKSVALVGTYDENKNSNLAIISSLFHLGAHPPLIGMIIRPHSVPRHTLENILSTKFYTINHIREEFYKQAHQTSARYDRDVSEFEATNLQISDISNKAPYVNESQIKFLVEYVEHQTLKVNDTVLVIGKIVEVHLPEEIIESDGALNIEMAGTITCSGLDRYHKTEELSRLPYAKPNIKIE
ncbi:flavin reductase family protein [Halobacteriovorax sp. GB3]|uniref:flavin reductase family protein n=1 Tax=Halobacteriovorax sp. GB3 TaxID=2719615 RepID=UPI00235FDCD0|nr:flavin reductase family protein [Halobacteriovorax sp. GB3]MDD0854688.1 flavin reductase family protein [Halobacteriovorax sp. GB3]